MQLLYCNVLSNNRNDNWCITPADAVCCHGNGVQVLKWLETPLAKKFTGWCRGHLIQTFRPNPGSSSVRKDNVTKTGRRFYAQEWWELVTEENSRGTSITVCNYQLCQTATFRMILCLEPGKGCTPFHIHMMYTVCVHFVSWYLTIQTLRKQHRTDSVACMAETLR